MLIINPEAEAYCEAMSEAEPDVLQEINRDTHAHVLQPRMLSGHYQGRLLALLSALCKPEYILEVGTYTAYSAICLAEGLQKGGKLISIDINEELYEKCVSNIKLAGMEDRIELLIGNAKEIIQDLPYLFDIVFIDADKLNYRAYYDIVVDKVRTNGLILIDNVLWSGKVYDSNEKDKTTEYLRDFNTYLGSDNRIEKIMLPIRDGLFLARKK